MIVPLKNAKTYGVLHTENYFSFLGFSKKVNSDEVQKVDVYLDDELIDTIIANKHLQKIEDIYELEGFGFEYILPNEYIGKKNVISFKNHKTQENLQNSPYELINLDSYNFNEANFIHSLSSHISKEKIETIYRKDTVSFIAIKENIEDLHFIKYIHSLAKKFSILKFKIFYFNKEQKQDAEKVFEEIKNKEFFIPKKLEDISINSEIYIHNYILDFTSTFSKQFYWNTRELIKIENKLFVIDLTDTYKQSNKNSDINLICENTINFNDSIISKIFENNEKVHRYNFINSLTQPINEEKIKNVYTNSIGFLSLEENLKSQKFVNYIKELMIHFPNVQIKALVLEEFQKNLLNSIFNNIKCIHISTITDIANEIEVFIWDFNNSLDLKTVQNLIKNFNHVFPIYNFYNPYFINLEEKTLLDLDNFFKDKNEVILKNPKDIGFTGEEILLNGDSYHKLIYGSLMKRELGTKFEIDLNSNALEFLLFTQVKLALNFKNFKKDFIKIHKLRLGLLN